jgi:hypothetical protein
MKCPQDNIRGAGGMTLVEALVATSIMAVVMTVVVPIVVGVRTSWESAQSGAESVQNERILADHLYRHLVAATAVTDISASTEPSGHIEFKSSDGNTYRYEIGGSQYVQFGRVGGLADLAGPVSQLQFSGFSADDFTTPATDVASIRLVRAQATFPKSKATGRDRTISTEAYLRPGVTAGGQSESTFNPNVALKSTVSWSGSGTRIDSYHSSNGAYSAATSGQEAIVSVNSTAGSAIGVYKGVTIYGDAYVGPGGDPAKGMIVTGTITGKKAALTGAVSIPDIPTPSGMPASSGSLSLYSSQTTTLSSNTHYSSVELSSSSKIVVNGNISVLIDGDLSLNSSTQIQVNSGYTARFYVKGNVAVNSGLINTTTANPSVMRIYMLGSGKSVQLNSSAKVHAVVQNPNGTVSVWSSSELFGKLRANALEGGGKIHVDLDCDFD